MSNHTSLHFSDVILPALILAVAFIVAAVTIVMAFGADTITLAPCTSEGTSQTDCYWDADAMGNGQGSDFVIVDGEVYSR